jgi:hypothetical protein
MIVISTSKHVAWRQYKGDKAMVSRRAHSDSAGHHHERKPLELGYRLVVRTILWVIVGAVFVGVAFWWFTT